MDHSFAVSVEWTGNRGTGTSGYRDFGRDNTLTTDGRPPLLGSAAKVFHGDADRWNPEETLMAALVECHLLSYLYLAAKNGIVVESYTDDASGSIRTEGEAGRFTEVTLRPRVTISSGDPALAQSLHDEAERICFIAQSVNFPVRHEPTTEVTPAAVSAESEAGA
jgi:organic hydroperoxide reductase OsmC/OhrA